MIVQAIDKILSLAEIRSFEFNDRTYSDRTLQRVRKSEEHAPEALQLHTLTGLVEFVNINAGKDMPSMDQLSIHVVRHNHVQVLGQLQPNNDNERFCYLETSLVHDTFSFGQFFSQESFIIGVNAMFEQDETRDAILGRVATMVAEDTERHGDDGISQTITVRSGIRLNEQVQVTNPVTLRPYRTFREVQQPASEFHFRTRQNPLGAALFESDGGAWKLDAINHIKQYLATELPNIAVWG